MLYYILIYVKRPDYILPCACRLVKDYILLYKKIIVSNINNYKQFKFNIFIRIFNH